jgi:flavodoxin
MSAMSKTLVTYFSRTGNTRKVAEAIFEEIAGDKNLKPMAEVEDLAPYQNFFVGFPVQTHSVPYEAEVFLKKIPEGKKVALFSTHGSMTGSSLSREALEYASVLVSKAKLVGTFSCRGKVSMKALEVLMKSPEHEAWADMAASAATHPDEHDLAEARAFARWAMTLFAQGHYGGL